MISAESRFPRYFYKPQSLCTREEMRAAILAIEQQAEGLQDDLRKGGTLL